MEIKKCSCGNSPIIKENIKIDLGFPHTNYNEYHIECEKCGKTTNKLTNYQTNKTEKNVIDELKKEGNNMQDYVNIKKDVYNHLIKTTNVVRTRNRQLEEESKTWRNRLVRTKKLNRKQKRFLRMIIEVALLHDAFSEQHYDEAKEMLKWLK